MDFAVSSDARDADALLRTVLQAVQDAVVVFDAAGVVLSLNEQAARLFGYAPGEVAGEAVSVLIADLSAEPAQTLPTRLDANYCGRTREVEARRKDGGTFQVELTLSDLRLEGQRCFLGTVRDQGERRAAAGRRSDKDKTLDDSGSFYRALMEGVTDYAILVLDPGGYITTWNAGARKLKGYEAEEIVGHHFSIFYTPEDRALGVPEQSLVSARTEGKVEEESLRVRKDGSRFWASQVIAPVWADDGALLGYIKVTRDITERKEADAAINDYVEKLKRSNQELDDFAYIASHDLKEPIRGLSNNSKFLLEDYADAVDDAGKRRLNRMVYLCQRMESLVDDLLYFSRLSRQELAIQTVDLNTVIRDIELMMEGSLLERGAEIVVPEPLPVITCDVPRVTEVFRNLITNAVKYNKQTKKRVEIGVSDTDGASPVPVFYVRDNGIGIEERFFSDIFRIFKRLNEEDDSVKGTGVGLTFVKKIVERHGGRIWLESEPGAGTTFYFTLQARKEPEHAGHAHPVAGRGQ